MNESEIVLILSSIVLASAPLIIAVCGETITERSGVVNLSLDGTLLMSAMTGFVAAYSFDNLWLGFLAGVTTMMANAAGPIMIIYLLAMRLPKVEFVGTGAWFFFIINWLKVPFSANLQLMTVESVKLDLMMLPFIALGALAGIFLLKRIPQKAFAAVVQIFAAAAAIKLLF